MKFELINKSTFIKKFILLALTYLLLIALVHFKIYIAAFWYLSLLIILHVVLLAIYLFKMPIREIFNSKFAIFSRLIGIGILTFLLTLVTSAKSSMDIYLGLILGIFLHLGILAFLYVKVN